MHSPVPHFPQNEKEKRAHLLGLVEQVIEIVEKGALEGEDLRHVPKRSAEAIRDARLVLIRTPKSVGGAEIDTPTQMDIIERIAYRSSAAAWCLLNNSNLLGMISANLSEEALEALYSGEHLPVPAGGGGMVPGRLVRVEGGFRLTGRWSWGSGIDGADWIVVPGALEVEPGETPKVFSCVFPKSDALLFDNWHVMGLKGTGSCDFAAEDVFVPSEFTYPHRMSGNSDGPKRGGPLYLLDIYNYTIPAYVGLLNGIARRALDEVCAIAENKKRKSPGNNSVSLADRQAFQQKLAEADLQLRSLRSLTVTLAKEAFEHIALHKKSDPVAEAEMRAVGSLMARTAVEAASVAFYYAGGSGIWSGHILERCLRDLQVANTHIWVSDVAMEVHGRNLIEAQSAAA